MVERIKVLLGGAALALAASGAHAATLEASGATVNYLVVGDTGELSTFGAGIDFADDVSIGDAELSLAVGLPLTGPLNGATGGFDVTEGDELSLEGMLSAITSLEDAVELTFDDLGGPLGEAFGSSALVRIDFDDHLGEDALAGLSDGNEYLAAVTVSGSDDMQIAPVPLPASGVLMAICMVLSGLYGWCRHRFSPLRGVA